MVSPAAPAGLADAEPDARFTFANERTFLAWSRTALASRPYAGIPILSGLIWGLGQLTRAPGTARAQSRRLLLIALAILGISIVALAIALLSPERGGLALGLNLFASAPAA